MDLRKLRQEIDATDSQILKALAKRRELVREVIRSKNEDGTPLRDSTREEQLLARLIAKGRESGLDAYFVTRIFHEIIDDSLRSQQQYLLEQANVDRLRRVAFQGIDGAYSHLAAQKFFSKELEQTTFQGYPTFDQVVHAVEEGEADCAFLPVENTTAGSINEVYDILSHARLFTVGEEIFRVEHCLLALPDAKIEEVQRILSHPQAIAQCMKFISNMRNARAEPYTDTAMAVRRVRDDGDLTQAAIASEDAGSRYGLVVLERNLADQHDNYTRFLVAARQPIKVDLRIPCKTSLVLATTHEEGALLRALNLLHEHKINITKLESRPRPGMPFQYVFYLDFEGNLSDPDLEAAIAKLRPETTFLKILGSYPVERRGRTKPAMEALLPPGEKESSVAAAVPRQSTAIGADGLAGRNARSEDTRIVVRDARIGGSDFVVVARTGAVTSREQILRAARIVKECGGKILHASIRAQGDQATEINREALELLAKAGQEYDLPVMTEVISPAEVRDVARQVDLVQIGARNMQNANLLREVGKIDRPVMLQRDAMSTVEELLRAAEQIITQGNHQVILCERGVRSFESSTRSTLDLGAAVLLKQKTHLPIFIDPVPAAETRDMVLPLALAARAVEPHGLLIELDTSTPQAEVGRGLGEADFARLMRQVYRV